MCGNAFDGCYNFKELHISGISSVPSTGGYSISFGWGWESKIEHFYVPASLVSDFQNDTYWSVLSSYISGIY
jgi:hypothetical protein